MADLDSYIKDYFQHNGQERFEKVYNELQKLGTPREILETICNSKHSRNKYHLGMFNYLGGRLLESSYYLKLYLEVNTEDLDAWIMLQYVSAKRGDLYMSSHSIKEIIRLGKDQEKYRAVAIHNMACRRISEAREAALFLTTTPYDNFTIQVVLEVALYTEDVFLISWAMNTKIGKKVILNSRQCDLNIIKTILIKKLISLFQGKMGNLYG